MFFCFLSRFVRQCLYLCRDTQVFTIDMKFLIIFSTFQVKEQIVEGDAGT